MELFHSFFEPTAVQIFAFIALFGWIPCVIVCSRSCRPVRRRRPPWSARWLLLPPIGVSIAGLPDFSKITAATLGSCWLPFSSALDRLLKFRPRWFDLPMLLFCFSGTCPSLRTAGTVRRSVRRVRPDFNVGTAVPDSGGCISATLDGCVFSPSPWLSAASAMSSPASGRCG